MTGRARSRFARLGATARQNAFRRLWVAAAADSRSRASVLGLLLARDAAWRLGLLGG